VWAGGTIDDRDVVDEPPWKDSRRVPAAHTGRLPARSMEAGQTHFAVTNVPLG
jgi:hypothetical protein